VFGKEMENESQMANISNMGIGYFILDFGFDSAICNPQPKIGKYAARSL
jgi:hypothetical protein